jgi:transposase
VQRALHHAQIVVDHFHLVRLANQAVTRVRQRVTREHLGRRGTTKDPAWANRRRLLRPRAAVRTGVRPHVERHRRP